MELKTLKQIIKQKYRENIKRTKQMCFHLISFNFSCSAESLSAALSGFVAIFVPFVVVKLMLFVTTSFQGFCLCVCLLFSMAITYPFVGLFCFEVGFSIKLPS